MQQLQQTNYSDDQPYGWHEHLTNITLSERSHNKCPNVRFHLYQYKARQNQSILLEVRILVTLGIGWWLKRSKRKASEVPVVFCFLIWVKVTGLHSLYENSLSLALVCALFSRPVRFNTLVQMQTHVHLLKKITAEKLISDILKKKHKISSGYEV